MSCEECDQSNKDRSIVWDGKSGKYHIEAADSYYNIYDIKYCPFCGEDLSKRIEDEKKYVLTVQQQVELDLATFSLQEIWEKIADCTKRMIDSKKKGGLMEYRIIKKKKYNGTKYYIVQYRINDIWLFAEKYSCGNPIPREFMSIEAAKEWLQNYKAERMNNNYSEEIEVGEI